MVSQSPDTTPFILDNLSQLGNDASPIYVQSIPEYKELIETPMDLSIVKSRLESKESPCYCSAEEFVKDVRLIFRNCAKYYQVWQDYTTHNMTNLEWIIVLAYHTRIINK